MANGDLGNDLKHLLGIAEADTTQKAMALATALQEASSRKLIQGVQELNAGVEKLNEFLAKLTAAVNRLNRGSRWLVGLTVVLTACTVALLFVGYSQLSAPRQAATVAPEASPSTEPMVPPAVSAPE